MGLWISPLNIGLRRYLQISSTRGSAPRTWLVTHKTPGIQFTDISSRPLKSKSLNQGGLITSQESNIKKSFEKHHFKSSCPLKNSCETLGSPGGPSPCQDSMLALTNGPNGPPAEVELSLSRRRSDGEFDPGLTHVKWVVLPCSTHHHSSKWGNLGDFQGLEKLKQSIDSSFDHF